MDAEMMPFAGRWMEIKKSFTFDAAHRLPHVPPGHRCARVHGHTYVVDVFVAAPLGAESGWVMDFGEVKAVVKPVIERLDHFYLNDIPGLENPTAEHIALWIFDRIAPHLPGLTAIVCHETPTSSATYRPTPQLAPAATPSLAVSASPTNAPAPSAHAHMHMHVHVAPPLPDALGRLVPSVVAALPGFVRGAVRWNPAERTLGWYGPMSEAQRDALISAADELGEEGHDPPTSSVIDEWRAAVEALFAAARLRDGDDIIASLVVDDEPLSRVLAQLGRQYGLNLVCKTEIVGRVTIVLEQVPVMVALAAILDTLGYTFETVRNPLPGGRPLFVVVPRPSSA